MKWLRRAVAFVAIVAAIVVAGLYFFIRKDLNGFNAFIDASSTRPVPPIVAAAILAAEDPDVFGPRQNILVADRRATDAMLPISREMSALRSLLPSGPRVVSVR